MQYVYGPTMLFENSAFMMQSLEFKLHVKCKLAIGNAIGNLLLFVSTIHFPKRAIYT